MDIFKNLFANSNKNTNSSGDVINSMLALAEMAMDNNDYERAVETYKKILELEPDKTAQYNLGSLYAQGKGVECDFMEGAYWFHQAALAGDENAGKLCTKCMMDFAHRDLDSKTPEQLYIDMLRFIKRVYPEEKNVELRICRELYALGGLHFNRREFKAAAKFFRAAAEFGNDGYSQNYLAVLYNTGSGIEKNDLAALYWFDKAVDNGAADLALKDRDGMLNAYRTNFTAAEFYKEMTELSGRCSVGSDDVPKDAEKAAYWREIAENRVKEK